MGLPSKVYSSGDGNVRTCAFCDRPIWRLGADVGALNERELSERDVCCCDATLSPADTLDINAVN